MSVEDSAPSTVDPSNLTQGEGCRNVCPFNMDTTELEFGSGQPCFYTVRIIEVFKGDYSVRIQEVVALGSAGFYLLE